MSSCTSCGTPLPDSHGHSNCSMCYGDIDYGTDGLYREHMEEAARQAEEEEAARRAEWEQQEEEGVDESEDRVPGGEDSR